MRCHGQKDSQIHLGYQRETQNKLDNQGSEAFCCAFQLQATYKRDSTQLKLHRQHLGILNPKRGNPRELRDEYERALAENASLKTAAAAGSEEVQMLQRLPEHLPMPAQ